MGCSPTCLLHCAHLPFSKPTCSQVEMCILQYFALSDMFKYRVVLSQMPNTVKHRAKYNKVYMALIRPFDLIVNTVFRFLQCYASDFYSRRAVECFYPLLMFTAFILVLHWYSLKEIAA